MKLKRKERNSLLARILDSLVPDEKYAVIIKLEQELKSMHYDWMMFNESGEPRYESIETTDAC